MEGKSAVMTHPMVGVKRDDDLPVGYGSMEETIATAKATNKLTAEHRAAERQNDPVQRRLVSERNERRNKTKRRRDKKRRRK